MLNKKPIIKKLEMVSASPEVWKIDMKGVIHMSPKKIFKENASLNLNLFQQ